MKIHLVLYTGLVVKQYDLVSTVKVRFEIYTDQLVYFVSIHGMLTKFFAGLNLETFLYKFRVDTPWFP